MCTVHQWGEIRPPFIDRDLEVSFIDRDLEVSFKTCLTVFHKCTYIQNDGRRSSYINVYIVFSSGIDTVFDFLW